MIKRCLLHFTLFIVFTIVFFKVNAQGFLRAQGQYIVNDKGPVILRGMGLGGWMLQEPYMLEFGGIANTQAGIRAKIKELIGEERTATFYNAWLTNHTTKADIDLLRSWGFNSVRLPIHYNLFTLPVEQEKVAGQNTWLDKGFILTDSLLNWCSANHIYLILDLHAAPGGQGNDISIADRDTLNPSLWQSEANKQKTIALWRKLAERYANEKWIGAYDLLNETNWGFTDANDKNGCAEKLNTPMRQLLLDITTAIRELDKNHLVIIEGNCWGNNYSNVMPQWDKNMALSFHKYWNYNDQSSIQNMVKMREQYNIPIWLGESGENSNVWFRNAIELLERNKMGWAWWPLKKLGVNNPLQIKLNEGYKTLLDYWRGKAPKPSADKAFNALMQFAADTRADKNILHKDVVDAMFRQTTTSATIPFKKHLVKNNSIVYAVDYDLGRNGFSYYDVDTANYRVSTNKNEEWNKGHQYRNDGVDITSCADANGYCVSWTEPNEWLQYTINVQQAGKYDLALQTTSKENKGAIQLIVNDEAPINVPLATTATQNQWHFNSANGVALRKGNNKIKVLVKEGGFDLSYLRFSKRR